jgi:predicted acylesterase/phospholipase RssA
MADAIDRAEVILKLPSKDRDDALSDPQFVRDLANELKADMAFATGRRLLSAAERRHRKEAWLFEDQAFFARREAEEIKTHGLAVPADLKALIKVLKAHLEFGHAREVLTAARAGKPTDEWIVQQLALCTYKDEELLPLKRFNSALTLLEQIGLRNSTTVDDPETLSLGGAVYKRLWEYGGQLEHIHESLALYREAWRLSLTPSRDPVKAGKEILPRDDAYSAVNAAFLLDVLAARLRTLAKRTDTSLATSQTYFDEARDLRKDALDKLSQKLSQDPSLADYDWIAVTMAELHFGLQDYPKTKQWLSQRSAMERSEWEIQTTFKQLVEIARLQQVQKPLGGTDPASWPEAWRSLTEALGDVGAARALARYRGKVGLALSGGGFRASLFHLGVLAKLAEMDVLRGIEALSTVSGGSIVGAHYYLEVQRLLEGKSDKDIRREDYIRLVRRVQRTFFRGIRKNLRTRALRDLQAVLRMIFSKSYSRSHRLGELYESEIYKSVKDGRNGAVRTLSQLLMKPFGELDKNKFKPKFFNWRREAKVPVLLLNTTSLNSGHSWQFTARWMGEPPASDHNVQVIERYRRLWYEQAPTPALREYRLGYAVAASACVPGLLEPLVIRELYPGQTVRLVDGGVHDNQGIDGLIDEGCTFILCSDASGQMGGSRNPSDSLIGVSLRSNSILMDRVRESQHQDLRNRVDSRSLHGLFFIHLKKDLDAAPLDWIKCQDPTVITPATTDTPYHVDRELQRLLSEIRTDLDSFTEVEAYSLMLSGYLMTEHEFKLLQKEHERSGETDAWGGYWIDAPRVKWPFLRLENLMALPPHASDARRGDLGLQLGVAHSAAFKVWQLSGTLRRVALVVGALVVFFVSRWFCIHWDSDYVLQTTIRPSHIVIAAGFFALTVLFPILKWIHPQEAMRGMLGKAGLGIAGWIASNIHIRFFDPFFLRRGRVKRLLKLRR